MRTEAVMKELILRFAQDHDDVRAVVMTGSRTNPDAVRDCFQDYDIAYLVNDVAPYRKNARIPLYFGDVMIQQTPDDMGKPSTLTNSYAHLMQFMDVSGRTFRAIFGSSWNARTPMPG